MAKRKSAVTPPPKAVLTEAQRFYLEKFRSKPAQELAQETGLDESVVAEFVGALPKKIKLAVKDGSVSMTAAQAMDDDDSHATRPKPPRPSYEAPVWPDKPRY